MWGKKLDISSSVGVFVEVLRKEVSVCLQPNPSHMKRFILLVTFMTVGLIVMGQSVTFRYDNSGNRTSRNFIARSEERRVGKEC